VDSDAKEKLQGDLQKLQSSSSKVLPWPVLGANGFGESGARPTCMPLSQLVCDYSDAENLFAF